MYGLSDFFLSSGHFDCPKYIIQELGGGVGGGPEHMNILFPPHHLVELTSFYVQKAELLPLYIKHS